MIQAVIFSSPIRWRSLVNHWSRVTFLLTIPKRLPGRIARQIAFSEINLYIYILKTQPKLWILRDMWYVIYIYQKPLPNLWILRDPLICQWSRDPTCFPTIMVLMENGHRFLVETSKTHLPGTHWMSITMRALVLKVTSFNEKNAPGLKMYIFLHFLFENGGYSSQLCFWILPQHWKNQWIIMKGKNKFPW